MGSRPATKGGALIGDRGSSPRQVWWETPEYLQRMLEPQGPPDLDSVEQRVHDEVHRRIESGEFDLTPLPITTTRAMTLIADPDVDFRAVAGLIKTDPILAAEVLKVVNSTAYGGQTRISDLDLAVARLGRMPLRSVLLGVSMKLTLKRLPRRELAEALWEHAVACSVVAQCIARETGDPTVDAFLGGLMHDIGMIAVVDAVLQSERAEGIVLRRQVVDFLCDELHQTAGLHVSRLWNLPAAIVPAITRHHASDPADLQDRLAAIVALAELLCHALAIGVRRICVDPLISAPVQALALGPGRTASVLLAAETLVCERLQGLRGAAGNL